MRYRTLIVLIVLFLVVATLPGAVRCADKPDITVESAYRSSPLFDNGDNNYLGFESRMVQVTTSASRGGMSWKLRGNYCEQNMSMSWGNIRDFSGQVEFREKVFCGEVRAGPESEVVTIFSSIQLGSRNGTEFQAGLWFEPVNIVSGRIGFGRVNRVPSSTQLHLNGEGGSVSWYAPARFSEMRLSFGPVASLNIATNVSEASLTPGSVKSSDDGSDFFATADGMWHARSIVAGYEPVTGMLIEAEYKRISSDLRILAYENGHRFAHFGVASLTGALRSISLKHGEWLGGFGWGSLDGELAGTVEAWPFVEGLARFLGERRHIVCEGNLRWHHSYVSGPLFRGKLSSSFGIDYLRVEPSIRYVTWRPAFFGFGMDDLKRDELDIRYAHLMRVKVGFAYRIGDWWLDCDMSQWLPLSVSRRSVDAASGEGESSTNGSDAQKHSGFSLAVRLRADF